MNAVWRRVEQGCLYGDFQFVIDPRDPSFLQRGAWLELLKLAHDDKATAFRLYAQHDLGTHGNRYWSDSMQLSTYLPGYAEFLAAQGSTAGAPAIRETLVIGEHYVPRDRIGAYMEAAREVLQLQGVEVI